jgi:hypothetical protein
VSTDALALMRRQLREQLRQRVDARGLATAPRTERRVRVREEALEVLRQSGSILPQRELTRIVNEVSDEVVGFGPIEFLLKEPEVTEVMVNGPGDVYVERRRRIERVEDGLFEGEEAVQRDSLRDLRFVVFRRCVTVAFSYLVDPMVTLKSATKQLPNPDSRRFLCADDLSYVLK